MDIAPELLFAIIRGAGKRDRLVVRKRDAADFSNRHEIMMVERPDMDGAELRIIPPPIDSTCVLISERLIGPAR